MEEDDCDPMNGTTSVRAKEITHPKVKPLAETLRYHVIEFMKSMLLWDDSLLNEIPSSWTKYNNFIVFNTKYFQSENWQRAGFRLWQLVSNIFEGRSLAVLGTIQRDGFRTPNARVVYGPSPWIEHVDNGIRYTWNVENLMFSSGNVSERHRIAKLKCEGQIVVDMFAGIGYFTLPYLVHARAAFVHACEWNQHAIEALRMNLYKNDVSDKCLIHFGDTRQVCPVGVADHVNLGLIPSCQEYWRTACLALKPKSGGVLRIHENVTTMIKEKSRFESVKSETDDSNKCIRCVVIMKSLHLHNMNNADIRTFTKSFEVVQTGHETVCHSCPGHVGWKQREYLEWAVHTLHTIGSILFSINSTKWKVSPVNIHRVKSYAPHIDHVVLDVHCVPA